MRFKVQNRIVLLISLLMAISVLALFIAKRVEFQRMSDLYRSVGKDKDVSFDKILQLSNQPLADFVRDYTYWDDMVRLVERGNLRWANENIATTLQNYDITAAWVYRPDFSLVYSSSTLNDGNLTHVPLPHQAYAQLFAQSRFCHFFVLLPQGLMEIHGATIHPTLDIGRKTAPRGCFFVGRLYPGRYLRNLEKLTESIIEINSSTKARAVTIADLRNNIISFSKLLPGWDGKPAARLDIKATSPILKESGRLKTFELAAMLLFEAFFIMFLSWCLFRWVSRPLNLISKSLDTENPAPIKPLLSEKTEFSHIAQMITRFFVQKKELLNEIAERKRTEAKLLKTQQELLDAKRLSDIGTLAATVAHELRNPLGVIRIAAYNIQRKSGDTALAKHIAHIDQKILEAEQIIKNLLFYSRIKMPQYSVFDITELLRECIESVKCRFVSWEVALTVKHAGAPPCTIEADRLQMIELFSNLLTNAYESFPERKGTIRINTWRYRHLINISVQDNGAGISDEERPNLFEPFFTTKSAGTGLGLTVCQQIVNLHRGTIDVKSRKNEGTTFTVSLPLERNVRLQ